MTMNTQPIELANAKTARSDAWAEYMQIIERPHTSQEFNAALHKAGMADKNVSEWYDRWQAVGGTSDIESIVDAEKFLMYVEQSLTDPTHIATAPAWMIEAQAQAADAEDERRTLEDARL